MPPNSSINKIAETIQNPRETVEIKSNDNINDKEKESDHSKQKDGGTEDLDEINNVNKEQANVEESDIKTIITPTAVVETSDDVKTGSDDTKHKAANVIVSPTHEDSDYEDNIVVTVPSASDTRTEKYLSRHHNSHPKPPGIEQNSPKNKNQVNVRISLKPIHTYTYVKNIHNIG